MNEKTEAYRRALGRVRGQLENMITACRVLAHLDNDLSRAERDEVTQEALAAFREMRAMAEAAQHDGAHLMGTITGAVTGPLSAGEEHNV